MVLIKTWNGIEGNFAEGNFDTKHDWDRRTCSENFEYAKTQNLGNHAVIESKGPKGKWSVVWSHLICVNVNEATWHVLKVCEVLRQHHNSYQTPEKVSHRRIWRVTAEAIRGAWESGSAGKYPHTNPLMIDALQTGRHCPGILWILDTSMNDSIMYSINFALTHNLYFLNNLV